MPDVGPDLAFDPFEFIDLSLRLAVWRSAGWGLQPGQSVIAPELSLGIRL